MSDEARRDDVGDRLEELLSEHREAHEDDPEESAEPDPYDPFAPEPRADGEAEPGGEEDKPALPDAPLFALLRTLEEEITAARFDTVWIFPPRRIEVGETAVVVVAAFTEPDSERRRVYAAHYTALDDHEDHRLAVAEYGTAPTERVGRLVEEVVERIKEGPTGAPRSVRIRGDERQWHEMLHELAVQHLETRRRGRGIRP